MALKTGIMSSLGKKNAMVEDFKKLENEMLIALKKIHR